MINIKYLGTSKLSENINHLLEEIFDVIVHADSYADITVNNKDTEIIMHVKPSNDTFKQKLVSNLRFINSRKRQYRIRFSSSLAISKIISFTISTESLVNVKIA